MRSRGRHDAGRIVAVIALSALTGPWAAVASTVERPTDVRTFVTRWYPRGIQYSDAKAFGPQAVPELVAMLKDAGMEEHQTKIVWVLGCIGDPSATSALMEFLTSQKGEVSTETFRATLAVFPSLGHLARGGDGKAFDALSRFARPGGSEPSSMAFSYRRYKGAVLGDLLGRTAVQGLGIAGTAQAQAVLDGLAQSSDLPADWRDNIDEALKLNARVVELGADRAFREEDQR
jgi:hypothetical protein